METKICTKCKRELPATKEYFSSYKKAKCWLEACCKECKATAQRERAKKYSEQRKEERKIYKREWFKNNKDKVEEHEKRQEEAWHREAHKMMSQFRKNHKWIFNVCSICGAVWRMLAHHPNYSEPTKVIIVCDSCHQWIHRWRIKEDKELVIDILELDRQAKAESHQVR